MTYTCQDDGCTYLSRGEEYHVTGYVTVRVYTSFRTTSEPGECGFEEALMDGLDFDDIEIESYDDLDYEVEEIEYDGWED